MKYYIIDLEAKNLLSRRNCDKIKQKARDKYREKKRKDIYEKKASSLYGELDI